MVYKPHKAIIIGTITLDSKTIIEITRVMACNITTITTILIKITTNINKLLITLRIKAIIIYSHLINKTFKANNLLNNKN